MTLGRVYVWTSDTTDPVGGRLLCETAQLMRLDEDGPGARLSGRYVRVRNASTRPASLCGGEWPEAIVMGDAAPDPDGNFFFEPSRGGARVDREPTSLEAFDRYLEASRFGEVNTYYHLDRIAGYVDGLLQQLGVASLPRVTAVVNAHAAIIQRNGITDGVRYGGGWRPFQGGHYRLPGPRSSIAEVEPVSPDGEIHLGPGRELLTHGALALTADGRYRHNASHNGAILYHEYGHHITRHTADFLGNARRPAHFQDNRKISLDEGICDYWVATLLDSPGIWAWHRRQDGEFRHRRSLTSTKTIATFDPSPDADPHANGTIWAAALWDLRSAMDRPQLTDLLLVKMLVLWRTLISGRDEAVSETQLRGQDSFEIGLALLLLADDTLFGSIHRALILDVFAQRGVRPADLWSLRPVASFQVQGVK